MSYSLPPKWNKVQPTSSLFFWSLCLYCFPVLTFTFLVCCQWFFSAILILKVINLHIDTYNTYLSSVHTHTGTTCVASKQRMWQNGKVKVGDRMKPREAVWWWEIKWVIEISKLLRLQEVHVPSHRFHTASTCASLAISKGWLELWLNSTSVKFGI